MAKPPCVLFLFDWCPVFWSTREEYFRQLAEQLSARGVTPVLFASELKDDEVRRRFTAAGARVEICSYHHGKLHYWQQIRNLQAEFSIQLAHVRFFDYFSSVHWACWLAGARTIIFTEANSGESGATGWRQSLMRIRTAVMCWPITQHIAISEFIGQRLRQVGIPGNQITCIYNGVDTTAFGPDPVARKELRDETGASPETLVLIFAATLLAWKRPEIIVQVLAELVRRGHAVQLWMAGTGPLHQQLVELADSLKVTSQIKWLGYQKDPQRWMAAADLFVHTAAGEAFGNVFIEAMSCGLPVVASRSGAAPELVVEFRGDNLSSATGLLVDVGPEEVVGLADAVLAITSNPDRYAALSRAAIQQSKLFSTEVSVARAMAVYDPLLHR
ncbi:MAG: glycosyltransferase family 4 protein [Acidobacteriota bacterium]